MEVCYRHPDRETGVACSNCGRPICPDCMTATSVGMRCPECAGDRQRVVNPIRTRSGEPALTYLLIGINVAIGLGAYLGGASLTGGGAVVDELAVSRDAVGDGELWRIVTSGFVHYGLPHLLVNMLSLYILGSMLEPEFGRARFAAVYFVSLLGGTFGALLLQPGGDSAGASGAVFGLFGAAVVALRRRGIGLMESGLGLWLGLNLILSLRPGISLGGHLGGFVAGALVAYVLLELRDRVRVPQAVPIALSVLLGAVAVAGAIAVSG
jgi:membrane associated rhomboid family serine protease